MSNKPLNCWEFKKCGREPGGDKTTELGVCQASREIRADGLNRGKNGGRSCWAISGTLCDDKVQGTFALKLCNCLNCEFFKRVVHEEGRNLIDTQIILRVIREEFQ